MTKYIEHRSVTSTVQVTCYYERELPQDEIDEYIAEGTWVTDEDFNKHGECHMWCIGENSELTPEDKLLDRMVYSGDDIDDFTEYLQKVED